MRMNNLSLIFAMMDAEMQPKKPDAEDGNEAKELVDGAHRHEAAADLEEAASVDSLMSQLGLSDEPALAASLVAQDEPAQIAAFSMPPVAYTKAGRRHQLMFEGVCTHCAHCGQPLTDAVSMERGIGPICSKKGYSEDPKDADEMQAIIDLAEFPALVEYVTTKYKPLGVRAMMNGLVKICSLNRRSPVHAACTDAIESLGFRHLASTLRESIAVVEIKDCKEHPGMLHVWVKKSDWSWSWSNAIRTLPGSFVSRQLKGTIVPERHKRALWEFMLKYYGGLMAKTPTGTIKIVRKKVDAQKDFANTLTPSEAATSN
jgi:hypothetical protein